MLKFLKSIFYFSGFLIVALSLFAWVTGRTYLFKAVAYNFADIDDYRKFSNNTVAIGQVQPWSRSAQYNQRSLPDSLLQELEGIQSIGLFVSKGDSVVFEKYWNGYSDSSLSGSFSMAKSITSLLIGVALGEGKIRSLEDPVSNYLPEFKEGEKAKVRIADLLTMSSGSDWDESYSNPFSVTTEIYYGSNAYKTATGVKIIKKPGTLWEYKSGDTQLLGLILEKVTGKSLSAYASEKLWQPLGAQHPALWSTDRKDGNEKAYCCFNSNAPDFARIGKLMLDSGRWNGRTIIPMDYYLQSIRPCQIKDKEDFPCNFYGYQWWLVPFRPGVFYARGILGQYIIVVPEQKLVIVRLGEKVSPPYKQSVPRLVNDLINWGITL